MTTRDEYVTKMKSQLDRWNEDLAKWEEQARRAGADARQRYEKELTGLKAQREKALYQMKLLQGASTTAWSDSSINRRPSGFDFARPNFLMACQKTRSIR